MDEYNIAYEVIPLPPEALEWLRRALQWPEDLEQYDKIAAPTPLTEIGF